MLEFSRESPSTPGEAEAARARAAAEKAAAEKAAAEKAAAEKAAAEKAAAEKAVAAAKTGATFKSPVFDDNTLHWFTSGYVFRAKEEEQAEIVDAMNYEIRENLTRRHGRAAHRPVGLPGSGLFRRKDDGLTKRAGAS